MFDPRSPSDRMPLPGMGSNEEPPLVPEPLTGRPPADGYLLFAALLPDPATCARTRQMAQTQRRMHGLKEPAMAADRSHMTVQPIAAFAHAIPQLIVDSAISAAAHAMANMRAVPITFDRVGSLGQTAPAALVLLCDPTSQRAITALRNRLAQALRPNGFLPTSRSVPHLTLVYGTDFVAESAIEPIRWTANRLVLVLSHHGRSQHIAEWPLA